MKTQELKIFLNERKSLNLSSFCREAGFSRQYLHGILNGEYNLTKPIEEKLIPVMKKYGYQ